MASTEAPPSGVNIAPAPWLNLSVTTYIFCFWSKSPLLEYAYAPLEGASSFADPKESGAFKGGLSMIEVVRYNDTPVGPYDEIVLVPGFFEIPGTEGKNGKRKQMPRCTRIYVSQKDTLWNGRHNWNIPKHLANFSFTTDPDTWALKIEVSPPRPGSKPFFSAELSKVGYLPAFPFTTNLAKYFGMDLRMAQPPLPAGAHSHKLLRNGEVAEHLCGTEKWRVADPKIEGRAKMCWVKQTVPLSSRNQSSDSSEATERDGLLQRDRAVEEGWWPAYQPWSLGMWIEEGKISFQDSHVDGVGGR